MPGVTIDPAYCPFTTSISQTNLQDGSSALTKQESQATPDDDNGDYVYDFFYNKDLLPIRPIEQTQTVTLTATSSSIYGAKNAVTQESGDWDLTFNNPCKDPAFTEIVPSDVPEIDYTLNEGELSTKHIAFTVNILPVGQANLCGELQYAAFYDNS